MTVVFKHVYYFWTAVTERLSAGIFSATDYLLTATNSAVLLSVHVITHQNPNIEPRSKFDWHICWVHCCAVWMIQVFAVQMMRVEWKDVIRYTIYGKCIFFSTIIAA